MALRTVAQVQCPQHSRAEVTRSSGARASTRPRRSWDRGRIGADQGSSSGWAELPCCPRRRHAGCWASMIAGGVTVCWTRPFVDAPLGIYFCERLCASSAGQLTIARSVCRWLSAGRRAAGGSLRSICRYWSRYTGQGAHVNLGKDNTICTVEDAKRSKYKYGRYSSKNSTLI